MNILLVEDNKALAGNIIDYLGLLGHQLDYASHGKQALSLANEQVFDVIVLDVMMPGIDGFETCRLLRQQHQCQTPILLLTARTELEHKLQGFAAGGDDYLTKPFDMKELICRLNALNIRGPRKDIGDLQVGDLSLANNHNQLSVKGEPLHLNNIQYKIMQILMQAAPATVNRQTLEQKIWGTEPPLNDVLKTHIYQLRKILAHKSPAVIETDHGRGYRLKH